MSVQLCGLLAGRCERCDCEHVVREQGGDEHVELRRPDSGERGSLLAREERHAYAARLCAVQRSLGVTYLPAYLAVLIPHTRDLCGARRLV